MLFLIIFFTTFLCSAIFTKVAFSMRTFFFLFGMESSAARAGLKLYVAGADLEQPLLTFYFFGAPPHLVLSQVFKPQLRVCKARTLPTELQILVVVVVCVCMLAHAYIHTQMCTYYNMYVEVRGRHGEVSSLLPLQDHRDQSQFISLEASLSP